MSFAKKIYSLKISQNCLAQLVYMIFMFCTMIVLFKRTLEISKTINQLRSLQREIFFNPCAYCQSTFTNMIKCAVKPLFFGPLRNPPLPQISTFIPNHKVDPLHLPPPLMMASLIVVWTRYTAENKVETFCLDWKPIIRLAVKQRLHN